MYIKLHLQTLEFLPKLPALTCIPQWLSHVLSLLTTPKPEDCKDGLYECQATFLVMHG